MKDVTSTSFGLLIAYLLPGIAGLYATTFVSPESRQILDLLVAAKADAGLFIMVILVAVGMGLIITTLRWKIFEVWFCSGDCLKTEDFAKLGGSDNVLTSFQAANDEYYRYHQFWGGITILLIPVFSGWICKLIQNQQCWRALILAISGILVEVLVYQAARESLNRYHEKAKAILGGNTCQTDGAN